MSIGRRDMGKIPRGKPLTNGDMDITQQLGGYKIPYEGTLGTKLPDYTYLSNEELSTLLRTTPRNTHQQGFSDPQYSPTLGEVIGDRFTKLYRK